MATYYVDSNATGGGNTGADWANAWLSINSASGVASGDEVRVASDHSETVTSGIAFTNGSCANPINVISCNSSTDAYERGAAINLGTGATLLQSGGGICWEGIDFDKTVNEHIYIEWTYNNTRSRFKDCTFDASGSTADRWINLGENAIRPHVIMFDGCTFYNTNSASYELSIQLENCIPTFKGCTFADNMPFNASGSATCKAILIGCDLSANTSPVVTTLSNERLILIMHGCKLHASASFVLTGGTIDGSSHIRLTHCQVGTDSDPSYVNDLYTTIGKCTVDTARYRTGGASDGERTNPVSWSIETNANAKEIVLTTPTPPIVGWTDGDGSTPHTYRIYFASGATLQTDEIHAEIFLPNDAATDSLADMQTTEITIRDTPSNHTTDSGSTWNGTDVGTKQYIEFTHTPDKPGPMLAFVYLGKASERVSIDPVIWIDE